jgi:hypothetical protein
MSTEHPLQAADPRFPIGKFQPPAVISADDRSTAILTLSEAPAQFRNAVRGLDHAQLETPYREGGWNPRQVIHHVADSHSMALARLKLALTEDWPTIFAYKESAWAELHDTAAPVEWSLDILEGLHGRWVMLLQSLSGDQWQRGFTHPERGRMSVDVATQLYAWHSRHHTAHITHLRAAQAW